jgi:putative ABC transport system permease protein
LLRSVLTALAIIIGTASVISLVSIGGSAQKAIEDSISDMGSQVLSVVPGQKNKNGIKSASISLKLTDSYALEKDKEISWRVSPEMRGNKQIKYRKENANIPIFGITTSYFSIKGMELESGALFNEDDELTGKKVAVIGFGVSKELNTTNQELLNNKITVGNSTFRVIGILEEKGSGGWDNPDERIYIPILTASERIFGRIWVNSVVVETPKEISIPAVMIAIERVLRRTHDISPGEENDFKIMDWSQIQELKKKATSILTTLIVGIAGISLLVGGIGVMNIMLVSVTERTREIGLRKALGATQSDILVQFIVEAVLLCIIGGLIGVVIGCALYFAIASYQEWPIVVPFAAIFGSVIFSAMVGLFFGIWPARRAAKLDPAVALLYE